MLTTLLNTYLNLNTLTIFKWLYIDFSDLIFLCLIAAASWSFFSVSSFRYKVYYFILNIFLLAVWGFSASFDGLVLMMLVTEFTVAVFFIFLFITSKFKKESNKLSNKFMYIHLSIVLIIYLSTIDLSFSTYFFFFNNIYPYTTDIIAHDLAIVYVFVLYLNPLVTVHLSVILGLFSIFFICLYFTLKFLRQRSSTKIEDVLTLRKQLLLNQSYYNARLRLFQKK